MKDHLNRKQNDNIAKKCWQRAARSNRDAGRPKQDGHDKPVIPEQTMPNCR